MLIRKYTLTKIWKSKHINPGVRNPFFLVSASIHMMTSLVTS